MLAGCAQQPEGFWTQLANETCRYSRKCNDAEIDSIKACREADFATNGTPEDFAAECPNYDPSAGRECLRWVRKQKRKCRPLEGTPVECHDICGDDVIQFYSTRSASGETRRRLRASE